MQQSTKCTFLSKRVWARESESAHTEPDRKFGKLIQKRQLDIPEYAASFVNYKSLKKVPRPDPAEGEQESRGTLTL